MIVYNDSRWLTDDTQLALARFVDALRAHAIRVTIGETYRTPERQAAIWKRSQERIAAGKSPLTKTQHSWHTTGRAADVDIYPATIENIAFYIETARALGFKTMVDPEKIQGDIVAGVKVPDYWDWHHIEYRNGRDFNTAFAEYGELDRSPRVQSAGLAGMMQFGAIAMSILGLLGGKHD